MAEQPTLTDPVVHSLWIAYVEGRRINHDAWVRAIHEREFVGTCRMCGDYLQPLPPRKLSPGRVDYEACCRNAECGWEVCAPGGRLASSGRR